MQKSAPPSTSSYSTRTAACFSDDYVSNVCLKHLMRSCINCTINKQYTRSKNIPYHHHCPLKRTTTLTSTLKMTMVTTTRTTTTTATATATTTTTTTNNHSHHNNNNSSSLCKSQGANTPSRYQSRQSLSSLSSSSTKAAKQQQQHTPYTNTIIRAPSTYTSSSSPSSLSSSETPPAAAAASPSATSSSALASAFASASTTSVSISSPYLHTVYSKKHMGRRKRCNVSATPPDDCINSCLRILLIVSFIKPLNMWYHFIKSVILTSLKQPTDKRLQPHHHNKSSPSSSSSRSTIKTTSSASNSNSNSNTNSNSTSSSTSSSSRSKCIRVLPPIRTTSFITLLTIICLETILLSTMSSCAKTFYMHWNTSNSIFRIDNTDHIIDVNKGNLAFEFDQVHIICPVYEPGTYENETEKYIIYNVSKVEYETCRITNASPRVIAICDKPQKLMFFTITFRPFTPQPGGLEFLPGNDYYFISTSSKDDLYRRIGGRCSTDNMKVVFKVCCVSEEKNKTISGSSGSGKGGGGGQGGGMSEGGAGSNTAVGSSSPTDASGGNNVVGVGIGMGGGGGGGNSMSGEDINHSTNINRNQQFSNHPHHVNNINQIGINGINTGMLPNGVMNPGVMPGGSGSNNYGLQMNPMLNSPNGGATSINTNIDQFNRIPMQPNSINVLNNNIGGGGGGLGLGSHGGSGIMMTPGGHNGITMISTGGGGVGMPGIHQYHGQTGIRINNVPSTHHTYLKNINSNNNNNNDHDHQHYDKHPNEVVKNEELTYNSAASRLSTPFSTFFSWHWHWLCRIGTVLKAASSRIQTHYSSLLNYVLRIKQFVNFKSILYNNLIYSIIALFVILLIQLLSYNFVLKIITHNNNNISSTTAAVSSITTPKTNFLTSYDENLTHKKFTDEQQQLIR